MDVTGLLHDTAGLSSAGATRHHPHLSWVFGGEGEYSLDDPVEVIALAGFDPKGEPEIRVMANGSLYIVFNFMPPSWAEEAPDRFDDFETQLAKAVDLPVQWEDREFFRIEQARKDTVKRIQHFLTEYKR